MINDCVCFMFDVMKYNKNTHGALDMKQKVIN